MSIKDQVSAYSQLPRRPITKPLPMALILVQGWAFRGMIYHVWLRTRSEFTLLGQGRRILNLILVIKEFFQIAITNLAWHTQAWKERTVSWCFLHFVIGFGFRWWRATGKVTTCFSLLDQKGMCASQISQWQTPGTARCRLPLPALRFLSLWCDVCPAQEDPRSSPERVFPFLR